MVTCSLRAAIQEANALAGADAITLPAGTYVLTIAGDDDTCAAGDLEVTGDLTVSGDGADVTTIDANAASRSSSGALTITESFRSCGATVVQ